MSKTKKLSQYNGNAWSTPIDIGADAANIDYPTTTENVTKSLTDVIGEVGEGDSSLQTQVKTKLSSTGAIDNTVLNQGPDTTTYPITGTNVADGSLAVTTNNNSRSLWSKFNAFRARLVNRIATFIDADMSDTSDVTIADTIDADTLDGTLGSTIKGDIQSNTAAIAEINDSLTNIAAKAQANDQISSGGAAARVTESQIYRYGALRIVQARISILSTINDASHFPLMNILDQDIPYQPVSQRVSGVITILPPNGTERSYTCLGQLKPASNGTFYLYQSAMTTLSTGTTLDIILIYPTA